MNMIRQRSALSTLALCGGLLAQAAIAAPEPVRPTDAAVSAVASKVQASPAVRAEREARPEELRPEGAAVPQLKITLGKAQAESKAALAPDEASVDDRVARCLAKKIRAERRDCLIRSGER